MPERKKLSRGQVEKLLGCSTAQIQRFEALGKLTPLREKELGYSRVWYDPGEVERVAEDWKPKKRTLRDKIDKKVAMTNERGEDAARCFELFNLGHGLREVVVQLKLDPTFVRLMHEQWEVSFDDDKRRRTRAAQDAEEKRLQREHDRKVNKEEYMRHKVELARLEVRKAEAEGRGKT